MIGKICGTGSYVPEHFLDNDDLARLVDTSDEWIRERTGVVRRHIIEDDTTVSMAVKVPGSAGRQRRGSKGAGFDPGIDVHFRGSASLYGVRGAAGTGGCQCGRI